jgi:hypothetical protein
MQPQFRLAKASDSRFVAHLVKDFYTSKRHDETYGIKFDYDSTLETVRRVIEVGVCLIGSSSCAAAFFFPFPYNHRQTVGYVQFWTFKKCREIAILEHLIDECKKHGATTIWSASHPPNHTIARLYARIGFKEMESTWRLSV